MNTDSTVRLVKEILAANHLAYEEEEVHIKLRFDSSLVQVLFGMVGEQTIIEIRSQVLRSVPSLNDQLPIILRKLNSLNARSRFGKWVLHESSNLIALEYDLLGDHLQDDEFMTALANVARLADREDDRLQELFGGKKAFE